MSLNSKKVPLFTSFLLYNLNMKIVQQIGI